MKKKTILILAYDFPPYVSVGGLRPSGWLNYFNAFGAFPVVITRQWINKYGNRLDYLLPGTSSRPIIEETEKGMVIRAPHFQTAANRMLLKYGDKKWKLARRAITAFYEFAQFRFRTGAKLPLYFAADEYLSRHKVDMIVATGEPFVLFHYASKLSKKHNVPWIADYRDLWSQRNHIRRNPLLKFFFCTEEKRALRNCSGITTVSELLSAKIREVVSDIPIRVITNGYDPAAADKAAPVEQENKILSLALVGSFYDWHPVRSVFATLEKFIKAQDPQTKIRINFYGINLYGHFDTGDISDYVKHEFPGLLAFCAFHKKIPNDILLRSLATNNLMLLFNDYSVTGTKIFDFISVKRKILLCYTDSLTYEKLEDLNFPIYDTKGACPNMQEELIKENNAGVAVADGEQLFQELQNALTEFKQSGKVECHTGDFDRYSRKHLAEKMIAFIDEIKK